MTAATVLIVGNTYPVKDKLRGLGGRWNAAAKGWDVPADVAATAKALVDGAPANSSARKSSGGRVCCECGKGGRLVHDMEDGMLKHYNCCDMPPGGY